MSRRQRLGFVLVGLALAVCLGLTTHWSAHSASDTPRADRPTYTLGEKWLRNDGAYELVRIEEDRYIFAAGPDQEIHLTKDLAIAQVRRGSSAFEWNPPPQLAWPLEVGKWGSDGARLRWSVETYEAILVPAGTFQAFRIEVLLMLPGNTSATVTLRLWYAPDARQYVKAELVGYAGQAAQALHAFQLLALDRPAALTATRTAPAPTAVFPHAPAVTPFQLTLRAPADQLRVAHPTVTVAGLAAGGSGIQRVVVSLNGQEVTRQEERAPQRAVALAVPVTLAEGPNTLVVTATEADGTLHQEIRTVHYAKPVPVTVTIRSPEDRARLTEASAVLAAIVTSSQGVAKVTVTVNGAEVHQQTERTTPKSLVVTAPVTLREGANTLVVTASEPDGTLRQEVRTVHYDKPQPAPAPDASPPARPANRWAVVVGVGRHDHPQIPRLRYAVPDAEAIYQVLIGPGGFKPEHVLLLTDTTERKPTLRNLKWALGSFLARAARKDDVVLVFFAGHGAPEVDHRGLERDGLAKYLIPSDADPDDLYSTALPMDELQIDLQPIGGRASGGVPGHLLQRRGGRTDLRRGQDPGRQRGRAVPRTPHAGEGPGHHHGVPRHRGLPRDGGVRPRALHLLPRPGSPRGGRPQPGRDRGPPGALRVPRAAGEPEGAGPRRPAAPGHEGRAGGRPPAREGAVSGELFEERFGIDRTGACAIYFL